MKTIDQVKKEEAMFDKIGVYYDSQERRALHAKSETTIYGELKVGEVKNLVVNAKLKLGASPDVYSVEHDLSQESFWGYNGGTATVNNVISYVDPFFSCFEDASEYRNFPDILNFHGVIKTPEGETHSFSKMQANDYNFVDLVNYCFQHNGQELKFRPSLKFSLNIAREQNEKSTFHQQKVKYFKSSRDNLEPKEWFTKICDPSVSTTETAWRVGKRYPAFRGKIKSAIFRSEKRRAVFLIEYLYGLKVNKTATIEQLHSALRSVGYSDFGVKDVRKMMKVVYILDRYSTIERTKKNLEELGVKPVKGITRWLPPEQPNVPAPDTVA